MSPLLLPLVVELLVSEAAAATQEGVVRLRGNGDPIAGAVVQAEGREVVTTPDGRFRIELSGGPVTLEVFAACCEPGSLPLPTPSAEGLVIFLLPAPPGTEIVVEARRDTPHVVAQVLDRERVEKTPGTHDDPIRLIQALPGVTMTPEYSPTAGDLAMRGAAPGESRVYLDGIEIPYLYHFQQYASVIHTRMLDELAVYPSTFGAAFGDTIGGVVTVKSRAPEPLKVHGGANLNFIMGGGYVQVPVADQWVVSGSGRRSYLDLVNDSDDQYTVWPAFWDYTARLDQRPDLDHHRSAMVVGAGDQYTRYAGDTAKLDPVEQENNPEFAFTRSFHAIVLHDVAQGARSTRDSSVGLVLDRWQGKVGEARQERQAIEATLREELVLLRRADFALGAGAELQASWVSRFADPRDRAWPELDREAPLLVRGLAVDEQLDRYRGGLWAEPRWDLGALRLQPGLRLDLDSATATVSPQPRLGARWAAREDTTLRAAIGHYSQAPTLDALSPVTGDPELGRSRSEQAALGLDLAVAGRWELSLDGYGRLLTDAVETPTDGDPFAVDGHAWGAELTSRYRLRERFFSWASLALGRSVRGDHPFAYDQPYAASFVASYDFAKRWNVGLRYRYSAGLPITPIEGGRYNGDSDTYTAIAGAPFSERLPDYQKIDLHLDRDLLFRRATLNLYAEAWYVPKPNNTLYQVYSYDYSESARVVGPAFVPLLGARAEF